MAKTSAVNATASGAWQYGNAAADAFAKEDVQNLGANFDLHDHSSTKGLAVARVSLPAWTAFTATVTQSVSVTFTGAGGRFMQLGKLVFVAVDVTLSSAGTAANNIVVGGLPAGFAGISGTAGSGMYYIHGATQAYEVIADFASGTTVNLFSGNQASWNALGVAPAVTAASGDLIRLRLHYEAA